MMSFKRYTRNNVCQCCSRAAIAAWQIHNKAMLVSPDLRSSLGKPVGGGNRFTIVFPIFNKFAYRR